MTIRVQRRRPSQSFYIGNVPTRLAEEAPQATSCCPNGLRGTSKEGKLYCRPISQTLRSGLMHAFGLAVSRSLPYALMVQPFLNLT